MPRSNHPDVAVSKVLAETGYEGVVLDAFFLVRNSSFLTISFTDRILSPLFNRREENDWDNGRLLSNTFWRPTWVPDHRADARYSHAEELPQHYTAPNNYNQPDTSYGAEQDLAQFVAALRSTLPPVITATFHGHKYKDTKRYL